MYVVTTLISRGFLFLCLPFTSLSLLFLISFLLFHYFIAFSGIPSLSVQFTAGATYIGDIGTKCNSLTQQFIRISTTIDIWATCFDSIESSSVVFEGLKMT